MFLLIRWFSFGFMSASSGEAGVRNIANHALDFDLPQHRIQDPTKRSSLRVSSDHSVENKSERGCDWWLTYELEGLRQSEASHPLVLGMRSVHSAARSYSWGHFKDATLRE